MEAVTAMQVAWSDAFVRRDVEGLVALYAEQTAFYGSTAELYTSPEGVRSYFANLSAKYRWIRFAPPHVIELGPGAVAASGAAIFGTSSDGVEALLAYRMTHVIVRANDGWKIAVHHASPMPD